MDKSADMEDWKTETAREHYLQSFKRNNQPNELYELFSADVAECGKQIVELLKKRRLNARPSVRKSSICLQHYSVSGKFFLKLS